MLSLSIHVLLLSLTFAIQGLGVPGFGVPGQDRRTDVPDLRAVVLPAPAPAAEPLQSAGNAEKAGIQRPVAAEPATLTLVDPAPPPAPSLPPNATAAPNVPQAKPKKVAKSKAAAVAC